MSLDHRTLARRRRLSAPLVAAAAVAVAAPVYGAFTPGDLIVVQVGGTSAAAQQVSLLDYALAGVGTALPTTTLVASHPLDATGANAALTLPGNGAHDGHLHLSSDGQYLLLAGYRAPLGTAAPSNQSSAAVPRVVGRVDSAFNANTSTALTDAYSGGEVDAVASVNGSSFYVAGDNANATVSATAIGTTGGLHYATLGATTSANLSQTQTAGGTLQPDSLRNTRLVNGQVYELTASQGSFVNRGLFATATPLPTSGSQTVVPVLVNDSAGGKGQELAADATGKYVPKTDVAFADLSAAVPGPDTAYTTGGKAEFEKWSLIAQSGGGYQWQQVGIYALSNGSGVVADVNALDLTVTPTGTVDLFTATSGGVFSYLDAGGYVAAQPTAAAGTFSLTNTTPVVAAAGGTQFRGFVIVPTAVPEPTTAAVAVAAAAGALVRRRRRGAR